MIKLTADTSQIQEAIGQITDKFEDTIASGSNMDIAERLEVFFKEIAPKFLVGIFILVIGIVIVKILMRFVARGLKKSKIDPAAHAILQKLTKFGLYLLVIVMFCDSIGINITMFVAVISMLGLAVSLAVKDSLSNFASGIIIVFSHPFTIGDFIQTDDVSGSVVEIGLIYTLLNTIDNKQIYIPNGQLSSSTIINFSAEDKRRVDITFSISYSDDWKQAKELILKLVDSHPLALHEPQPLVRVLEYAASSVNIVCRVWANSSDYWELYFDLIEQGREILEANGMSIPFNQLDVHIVENSEK